jgi:hypothetical protein
MTKFKLVSVCICLIVGAWAIHVQKASADDGHERRVSEIAVDTGNGFGSTGTFARRFANLDISTGADITYVPSAVNGDSFVINRTAVYSISDTDYSTNGDTFSISLNSNPATEITGLSAANRLCSSSLDVGHLQNCTATVKLAVGDVIRAHRSVGAVGAVDASPFVRFIITEVSN